MEDCKRELDPKTWQLRKLIPVVAIAFALLLNAACGSGETESANNSNSRTRTGNSSNQNNSSATNSEAQPPEAADANVQSPQGPMNRKRQRLEQMRANAANSPAMPPVPVAARPAAENSEITIELRDVARETRTFKSHPTIARLEKVSNGRQIVVTVILKDGRRVELPGDSVPSIGTITTADLLRLVDTAGSRSSQTTRTRKLKKENR